MCNEKSEKNILAIYVSYYVKIKVSLNSIGGEISLKLPFVLGEYDETKIKEFDHEGSKDLIDKLSSNSEIELMKEENTHLVDFPSSSASETNLKNKIVHAQVHSHKYLESDV